MHFYNLKKLKVKYKRKIRTVTLHNIKSSSFNPLVNFPISSTSNTCQSQSMQCCLFAEAVPVPNSYVSQLEVDGLLISWNWYLVTEENKFQK